MEHLETNSPESLLKTQYWTFEQIIDLASWQYTILNPNDKSEFRSILAEKIFEETKSGTLHRIRPYEKNKEPLPELINILMKAGSLLVPMYFLYWMFSENPEHLPKGISPFDVAFRTTSGIFLGTILSVFSMVYFGMKIQKWKIKTADDRLDYVVSKAGLYGIHYDDIFEAEQVIDFLNYNFQLGIPKDPFRVWPEPFFKRNGEAWIVGFEGDRFLMRVDKGTQDTYERIAYLLDHPFKDIDCFELAYPATANEFDFEIDASPFSEKSVAPSHAPDEYPSDDQKIKDALLLINEKIENARERGDILEFEELTAKMEKLQEYKRQTFTRHGKIIAPRDEYARAKDTISQTRKRFIKKVEKSSPKLAAHLRSSIRISENTISYRPPEEISWDILIN